MNTSTVLSVTQNDDKLAMTSIEVAELVESRHDKVKQSIDRLAKRGVIAFPPMGEKPTDGRPSAFYIFVGERGKRDSYVVVAQLCPEFTARLVDRWQELEEQATQPQLPQSMAEALRLAADQAERIEQQERALQEAAPKIAFANQVEVSPDAITVGQAAKTIGTGRNRLFSFLRRHGWVDRRNEPYQAKIEAGLLDVKVRHWEHPEKGLQENITALVTGKGLAKLQRMWDQGKGNAA
ncbi:phage antirepressor KilAC domain-containing protein [Halomonas sp. I1]|uniref:phage antirepressor KilAC domain-containing protein n=1 Tax=Halomonas sp. I1 TaxID=393536 RepID=UPI0028E028B0|nr:phage antirepressor KilAC domain-containing protein [Halomonas sp. I1]MDT8895618.1 phage antirepressor KilAC domain-containing protein [Halomonas sp. I1]